jgi:predicted ATPase/DNA-binding SARP family transcriptional activator
MGEPDARVEVLGPLRLVVDGAAVEVPGPKRRAVLALLALAEGRTVTVDHLVDALWPAEPPHAARQALHTHVSRLRAGLGPAAARLQTRHDGYRLDLDVDLAQARRLLTSARNGGEALPLLRRAHALWRGPVLADLTDVRPIATAVEGCARLHREVTDALVAAALDAGGAADVVGLAAAAHAADPLREQAVLHLMRALAATGQAAEALRVGRDFRRTLADETGLDPGPALGALEREIASGATGAAPPRPRPTSPLFGREAAVGALHRLLANERMVTVVGAGGVGKTRVALEVAGRSDAATVLLLAPVTDPAALPHALAEALGLDVVRGDVLAACVAVLGDRAALLVIDNCEHLREAVRATVEVILTACPQLSVLATSREPVGAAVEYAYRLPPLALPEAEPDPSGVPSVAVFLDRARRVRPGLAPDLRVVADIVRRLDGLPLAIELAAGRLSTFSLTDLATRLDRALDLLGDRAGAEARHRTLRATVEWSYDLLGRDEQRLFRYLAVFPDGVDLDTAERLATDLGVADDPGTALSRLVDASMVDADFTAGTRYRMLETLRAFGIDRLGAAGEDDAAARYLIGWAVRLTASIGERIVTDAEPEADAALRRELANLRAAWRLARGRGAVDDAAAMLVALFDAVAYRDLLEIRGWADELARVFLEDPALTQHPRATAVLGVAAEAAYHGGDHPAAERLARSGLERIADPAAAWYCLAPLAVAALARGAFDDAIEHALGTAPLRAAEGPVIAALAAAYAGDLDRARDLHERGHPHAASPTMRSWSAYVAAEIASAAGRPGDAERQYREAIELARRSGATFLVGVATVGLLAVLGTSGRVEDALRGYADVIGYFARTGNWTHLWTTLRNLAALLRRIGDDRAAAALDLAADHAPEAPAVQAGAAADRSGAQPPTAEEEEARTEHHRPAPAADAPWPTRAEALAVAREAIARRLSRR